MSDQEIAIVGMACVLPKAANLGEYWSNIVNGASAIEEIPADRWTSWDNLRRPKGHDVHIPCSRGGFIPSSFRFDPVEFGVMPKVVQSGDPDQFLMMQIVADALSDADIAREDPVRERTDLIIGRGGYLTPNFTELAIRVQSIDLTLELLERKFPDLLLPVGRETVEEYLRSVLPPSETDSISAMIPNICASRAANRLNLQGDAYTVDAACASSLIAVEQAMERLRHGKSDVAIAAGLFLQQLPSFWHVFTKLGAISPEGIIRPFDRRADGLVVGEGGGAVVLKRLSDAIRDGDRVYAVLKGIGSASDGCDVDVLAPSSRGQVLALERAYADAGVSPDSIGYLEVHGTGTNVGDQVEVESIKQFFGRSSTPPSSRAMGSVKSMIGHTMPASGIASLIRVALALSNKVLPPSLNCEEPLDELSDAPFYVNTETRPWVHNKESGLRRAGVNTFGFGGINVHAILEEVPEPQAMLAGVLRPRPVLLEVERKSELIPFSAATVAELRARLERVATFLDQDETEPRLIDIAWSLSREFDFALPCKLAIVCKSVGDLKGLLKRCQTTIAAENPDFGESETIFFSDHAEYHDGKIVFIFPGMGFPGLIGNYPDHLLELCLHFPEVRAEFDFFETRDRHPDDLIPTSSIFCPPAVLPEAYRAKLKQRLAPPKLDKETILEVRPEERYLAAMGVTLANWLGWVLLQKLRIPVEMLAGQSQGELAAMCAAGAADFHKCAPHFWRMLNLNPRYSADQRLCFAWTSAEKVEPILTEFPGTYVAIYMAPEAVIFGGALTDLEVIADRLRTEQVLVQILPYPPIHTPCLSYLRDELNADLQEDDFQFVEPKLELYSSILADRYPKGPENIRETMMLNLDHPLKVWQTVRRLYEDGGRVFVQVGGGHMAAHMKMLLPEGANAITAALDSDIRDAITQLNILCGTLVAAGVSIELSALFENRTVNTLDFDAPQSPPAIPRTAMPLRLDWSPLEHPNVPKKDSPAATSTAPILEEQSPESLTTPSADLPTPESQRKTNERLMPLLGTITHLEPGVSLRMERRLSIEEDRYLRDHLFVHAADVKAAVECLPVMPMTMMIEMVAETASQLTPDLGLVGFENVRASRWIGLLDAVDINLLLDANVIGTDPETGVVRVEVSVFHDDMKSASAVVLFGEQYREDLQFDVADDSHEPAWPYPAAAIYDDRKMFHGPMFQVISGLNRFGNPSCSGTLRVLPKQELFRSTSDPVLLTDPCLNDGVGQLVGLWCRNHDWYVLPTGVEKIEIYGPPPPVGAEVPIRLEVTAFDVELRQMRSNIIVEDGQGYVWMRMGGWSDWIFKWPEKFTSFSQHPTQNFLGDEIRIPDQDELTVCIVANAADLKKVDQNWAMRIVMHPHEVPEYRDAAGNGNSHQFIASRCALKDAARLWYARKYGGEFLHPAAMEVSHDAQGRPFLIPGAFPDVPKVSLSHSGDAVIAVASEIAVGIDIEPLSRDTRSIFADFAGQDEIDLLDRLVADFPDQAWETRLWCAKEAASKALGTGLQGRPKNFKLIEIDEKGSFVVQVVDIGIRCTVGTYLVQESVIAYATLAENVKIR